MHFFKLFYKSEDLHILDRQNVAKYVNNIYPSIVSDKNTSMPPPLAGIIEITGNLKSLSSESHYWSTNCTLSNIDLLFELTTLVHHRADFRACLSNVGILGSGTTCKCRKLTAILSKQAFPVCTQTSLI